MAPKHFMVKNKFLMSKLAATSLYTTKILAPSFKSGWNVTMRNKSENIIGNSSEYCNDGGLLLCITTSQKYQKCSRSPQ